MCPPVPPVDDDVIEPVKASVSAAGRVGEDDKISTNKSAAHKFDPSSKLYSTNSHTDLSHHSILSSPLTIPPQCPLPLSGNYFPAKIPGPPPTYSPSSDSLLISSLDLHKSRQVCNSSYEHCQLTPPLNHQRTAKYKIGHKSSISCPDLTNLLQGSRPTATQLTSLSTQSTLLLPQQPLS